MRAGLIDLGELMARASGGADREGSVPLPEATADTLKERFAELNRNHPLSEGDLVIFKHGFEVRKAPYDTQPMLVVTKDLTGYPPPAPRTAQAYLQRGDIVLLSLADDGTGLLRIEDSRMLEPWPRAAAPTAESGEA